MSMEERATEWLCKNLKRYFYKGELQGVAAISDELASLLRAVRKEALGDGVAAIVEGCSMCDGRGFIVTTGTGHDCDGSEEMCARRCPVQTQEQEGCEYCGRPADRVRALISSEGPMTAQEAQRVKDLEGALRALPGRLTGGLPGHTEPYMAGYDAAKIDLHREIESLLSKASGRQG